MTVRNIKKSLAGVEDLAIGIGELQQERGVVHRVNVFPSSHSYIDMQQYEGGDFFRLYGSDVSYTDYRRNPAGTTGIPAGAGGVWEPLTSNDKIIGGNTIDGAYLADENYLVWHASSGSNYAWTGALPHTVTPGTDPVMPGSGYVPRTDVLLRSQLANIDGSGLVGAATYAQIRAYTGSATKIHCLGVSNVFDGGRGDFCLDSTDATSPDNGGTILVDSNGGRWKREYSGAIKAAWFGVKLDNSTDNLANLQAAIDSAGVGGTLEFDKSDTNKCCVSAPVKFYPGQKWVASGGIDVAGIPLEIKLTANGTSVAEPKNPAAVTYGFNPIGIYFNAQGFGDCGLSLYNTSYALVDQCSANVSKAGAAAILMDSDTSKQCYFNQIHNPRCFATGTGSVGIRFTRGANANQVWGGKCGSSYRGMEFLSASSGNIVFGTDFEDNSNRHVYVDAPSNIFIGTHMESCPIGFDVTAAGSNTQRMNTTFASSVTTQVQDASKTGTNLETRTDTLSTKGELKFGPAKFISEYLSTVSRLDYDPDLVSATSQAILRLFLKTTTTGNKQVQIYKGDGTSKLTILLNAADGAVQCGDISQDNGVGLLKKTIRRAAAPTTGTWSQGDYCKNSLPAVGSPKGWYCTVAGTPGTWVSEGNL